MVFGRLAPAATLDRATAELGAIAAGLDDAHPPPPGSRLGCQPAQLAREIGYRSHGGRQHPAAIGDDARRVSRLVVACTNLANLVLVRGTTRQRELAVRSALGATRSRLILEQCAESLIALSGRRGGACVHRVRGLARADGR